MPLTETQIESIQIDHGIIYKNFDEVGEMMLGPLRGGSEFVVKKTIREIEFDGSKGKSKGLQVLESEDASIKANIIGISMDTLALALPYNTYAADVITGATGDIGVIADSAYLTNITMFAKLVSGEYKKITLFNAMNESDLSMKAAPKGEMEVGLEIFAHWNPTDDTANLYKIEDVASIDGDTTGPTVTTVPADAAVSVVVTSDLTATFSEAIKEPDVTSDNFILMDVSDGTVVAGELSYVAATKVVTFDPTASLDASTDYIWVISNVRDTAGNKMIQVVVNFTTAA